MPEATPTSNSMPDVLPAGLELAVGGPPNDEAGCDGGGESVFRVFVNVIYDEANVRNEKYIFF